jgi:UDP-glucose 6-dehydrogenase
MILIFGYGTVGNAVHLLFDEEEEKVFVEDPKYQYKISDVILKHSKPKSLAVICVDAPFIDEAGYDTSNVCAVLRRLSDNKFKGLVLIKTTMFPNQIGTLLKTFSDLNIAIWPEFLSEATADEDILNQPVLFGGNLKQLQILKKYLPGGKITQRVNPEEAMQIKLLWNLYGATKVSFWHSMYNSGLYTPNVKNKWETWTSIASQGDLNALKQDGQYGYGGKCFPKDVLAYLEVFKNPFIETMDKMNAVMRYGSTSMKRDFVNSKTIRAFPE